MEREAIQTWRTNKIDFFMNIVENAWNENKVFIHIKSSKIIKNYKKAPNGV